MRLPFPGPAAVLGGATAAAGAVETALGLVPRAAEAMDRLEDLLDRVDRVVTRADQVVTRADETTRRSHAVVDTAEIVTRDAGRTVEGHAGSARAGRHLADLVGAVAATAGTGGAAVRRLAGAAEVSAAISLVDRMPALLDHVENDVLPMLQNLDRVGPDLHEVLEVVEDLRRVVTGLPGIGLLRKRGEEEPPPVERSLHEG